MSIFGDYGAPQFGLTDCKVATYNATNSYGTAVDVPSIQMMGVWGRIVSAILEGDDRETAVASRAVGGRADLRWGGITVEALEVLLGSTATSSVGTPNEVKTLRITGGQKLPYFGIVGKALAEEGGAFWVFVPKAKITQNEFQLASLQYGQFAIPEMQCNLSDDASYGAINLIWMENSTTAIAIPPANIPIIA